MGIKPHISDYLLHMGFFFNIGRRPHIMPEKPKTFLYKRASFQKVVAPNTLQSLIGAALKSYPKAKDRHENPNADSVTFRLINYNGPHGLNGTGGKFLGCEMFSYNKGADQGAINFSDDAEQLDVDSVTPEQGKEFLEGTVYFGVLDDHVIVMQSSALRCSELERHLNWFLKRKAEVISEENHLELSDNIPPKDLDLRDVKGLDLMAPIQYESHDGESWTPEEEKEKRKIKSKKPGSLDTAETDREKHVSLTPFGRGWDAIKALVGEALDLPAKMSAEDLLKTGRMSVKLSLNWRSSNKEDAADFVSDIAHRLRNIDDEEIDYSVRTRSGPIRRHEFKPTKKVNIKWNRVRPDFNDLFPKMLKWLDELKKSKKITI
jgi:hypothetical protein